MVGLLGSLRRSEIGVVISTESEFSESERSISSDSMFDSVAYYLVKTRLSESVCRSWFILPFLLAIPAI